MACLFPLVSPAQTARSPIDYLQVPGPILFERTAYHLAWASHPTPAFYKQEYLAVGIDPSRFTSMIFFDLLRGTLTVQEAVGTKVAELKKLKETNPLVSYQLRELPGTGEFLLDFLLSQATPDGKSQSIVERNVYRYKPFTDPSGKKGILLFGVSQRSYGADTESFLTSLKRTNVDLPAKVEQFKLPSIAIAR
ncbi:hypothetical protein GCM10028808_50200 [Spirosoma migulaei]